MIRLLVAFEDGSTIDETFPNHDIETLEVMVRETEDSLIVRVEIENSKEELIYQYKRKTTYGY